MPRRLAPTLLCLILAVPALADSPYAIDSATLGSQFRPERSFECSPSDTFAGGFSWCQRRRWERGGHGGFNSFIGVLQARDGAAVYVNRVIEPAYFGPDEMQTEIARLTTRFGERARVMRLPPREGLPNAVIAQWGRIELEQLDDAAAAALAAKDAKLPALLVDYLGNVKRSAELGLPVFRLAGGAGYLWSASADGGRGHLRIVAIDASAFAPPTPQAQPAPPRQQPVATNPDAIKPEAVVAPQPKTIAVVKMPRPATVPAKPETTAAIPAKIEIVRVAPAPRAHVETDGATAPTPARRWSAADVTVGVLAALALVCALLARRVRHRHTTETELHATARAQLRSRLGQGQGQAHALAREAGSRVAAAVASVHDEASTRLPFVHTLKSYVSGACLLTIAIMIYLSSQSPAAIKTFFASLSRAASPSAASDRQ
jgi:hypothetical protein